MTYYDYEHVSFNPNTDDLDYVLSPFLNSGYRIHKMFLVNPGENYRIILEKVYEDEEEDEEKSE